jgi:hypothetical protein
VAFRNRIINGNFGIWQRGTTPGTMAADTVAGEYVSADMWKVGGYSASVGNNFVSFTQLTTGLPTGVLYAGKIASTAALADTLVVGQYIESANSYSLVGQKVTISLKLKKLAGFDAGTGISVHLFRLNSKDVATTNMISPSLGGCTSIQLFSHTLTTSDWESVTFTTTSVLPAEAANGLLLHLSYSKTDMGASEKFAIAQVQLEPGTVATPFEFRPYGTELDLCKRYYRPIGVVRPGRTGGAGTTYTAYLGIDPSSMRTLPSVNGSGAWYWDTNASNEVSLGTPTWPLTASDSNGELTISYTSAVNSGAYRYAGIQIGAGTPSASAEL